LNGLVTDNVYCLVKVIQKDGGIIAAVQFEITLFDFFYRFNQLTDYIYTDIYCKLEMHALDRLRVHMNIIWSDMFPRKNELILALLFIRNILQIFFSVCTRNHFNFFAKKCFALKHYNNRLSVVTSKTYEKSLPKFMKYFVVLHVIFNFL